MFFISRLDPVWCEIIARHYREYRFWRGFDAREAFYSWPGFLFENFRKTSVTFLWKWSYMLCSKCSRLSKLNDSFISNIKDIQDKQTKITSLLWHAWFCLNSAKIANFLLGKKGLALIVAFHAETSHLFSSAK